MFSKEESKKIRQEFWTGFGKEYPRKWLLYNTKIREIQLKFTFNRKFAAVSMDVTAADEIIRAYYFEKLQSLKNILISDYLPHAESEENYVLPEGKTISRVYVELQNVNIHNKNDWPKTKDFLSINMLQLEMFFREFSDFIKD